MRVKGILTVVSAGLLVISLASGAGARGKYNGSNQRSQSFSGDQQRLRDGSCQAPAITERNTKQQRDRSFQKDRINRRDRLRDGSCTK